MSYVEIEVRAKTVDLAIEAAMQELGVDDRGQLEVKVITEPEKGFLGIGGQDAVVLVKRRQQQRQRGRGRKGSQGKGSSSSSRPKGKQSGKNEAGKARNGKKGREVSRKADDRKKKSDDRPALSIEEQAEIVQSFLEGLVQAYGLEGSVQSSVDDEVIVADVIGEQTEALVGVRGMVRSSIHELTRTVLQRYTHDTARLRLDIAGYAERRRQALTIYADQLIEQLMEEGGEIMLEPMSAADRKVIHDAAAAREGVRSYSEGESPRRFVVLAADESAGTTPASTEEE